MYKGTSGITVLIRFLKVVLHSNKVISPQRPLGKDSMPACRKMWQNLPTGGQSGVHSSNPLEHGLEAKAELEAAYFWHWLDLRGYPTPQEALSPGRDWSPSWQGIPNLLQVTGMQNSSPAQEMLTATLDIREEKKDALWKAFSFYFQRSACSFAVGFYVTTSRLARSLLVCPFGTFYHIQSCTTSFPCLFHLLLHMASVYFLLCDKIYEGILFF